MYLAQQKKEELAFKAAAKAQAAQEKAAHLAHIKAMKAKTPAARLALLKQETKFATAGLEAKLAKELAKMHVA